MVSLDSGINTGFLEKRVGTAISEAVMGLACEAEKIQAALAAPTFQPLSSTTGQFTVYKTSGIEWGGRFSPCAHIVERDREAQGSPQSPFVGS